MYKNNKYKEYFKDLTKDTKKEFYYSAYFLPFVEQFTSPLTPREVKYNLYIKSKPYWTSSNKKVYTRKDVNSMIFDKVAEKYGISDKSALKEHMHIIKKNYLKAEWSEKFSSKFVDHQEAPKFSELVYEDCYDELTEIIGITPDEYLSSFSA